MCIVRHPSDACYWQTEQIISTRKSYTFVMRTDRGFARIKNNQHREGVDALSSAIDRVKGTKTDAKAESVSEPKPSLASLLLAGREE